ncbi:MAG TPA: DUF3426 domain-containing protein [Moraxellaceae bacterium]|nr:DUF3426 domain-containing protein [Moraxellaceae bacterium]
MTDAKQTKCPHCGSTFRITDAQLAAKGGSVRCGSCLQVFRADLHLVGAAPAAPAAAPRPAAPAAPAAQAAPAAKPKPKAKGDESWALDLIGEEGGTKEAGGDEFGFSDDDISAFIAKGNPPPPEAAAPGKTVLFDDELSDQLEEAGGGFLGADADNAHHISDNADESWAKDILSEIQTEEKKASSQQYGMEIVDDKNKPAPRNPKLAAAVGMAPAGEERAPAPKPAAKPAARPGDDFLGDDADVLSFLDDDDLSQPAGNSPPPAPAANPFALERPLAHVDAPVVLKPQREPVRWGYILGWSFMCLVAVALFALQYVFFNFEQLATRPSVRPLLERTCQKVGCYVPDIPDPSLIKVDELVVRKHPDVAGALVVDAIVKNHATFPQPFPVLRLRFSNSADEIIASRSLKPAEYLQGEARMLRRMPPDTPVRISLEIVDPGKDAISYGLDPIL